MPEPCPHLPPFREGLDWRTLHLHRGAARGAEFYFSCLEYAQAQWMRGFASRAVLCLDRAFGADLSGGEAVLAEWPLPYAALAWLLQNAPPGAIVGNPRVHFQHYAGRMNEPRREQRRWRAWACWALVRIVAPHLPGDPRHVISEPSSEEIGGALELHGHAGEAVNWHRLLAEFSARAIV